MIIETMPLKTINVETHSLDYDGYVYTIIGETYNKDTYIRPDVVLPTKSNYTFPDKINLGYITVSSNEGLPQYVKYTDDKINMKPLQEYDYLTAIPYDLELINKDILEVRNQYTSNFLNAVKRK